MVNKALADTRHLLREKKAEVGKVVVQLLEKKVLSRDDMVELLGARPFPEKHTYEDFAKGLEAPFAILNDCLQARAAPTRTRRCRRDWRTGGIDRPTWATNCER